MKKSYQPPISIDKQIENLVSLGLEIEDTSYAKDVLNRVSYYRLIKAYSITLKEDGRYIEGTTFENIVELYLFDMEFRHILFSLIEHIEVYLRAVITNYYSLEYGNFGYKNLNNYGKNNYQKNTLDELEREINRNRKSPFIRNFKDNYEGGEIPLYAAIEVASLGTLSKMYKNMKNDDKKAISTTFGVDYVYLESWIENLAYVRNICAHHGRLYGSKLTKTPKLYKEYLKKGVSNNTIFASSLNLKVLAENKHYNEFYSKLSKIIDKYPLVDLQHLGFVNNWQTF
ncbi:Abi-like protein [Mageeibacillus indolicus UPII9-5]|uniref:Abi-like protein n=1 Tax=Mageeibacillus indolicus (strain UPII9-5) TaxID=699246 RepID=D3R0M8_MAGIU|nr:Abi family protein [Mageeibacillus indolicus]ADC90732.1 Abi-like protein [Mageeibacillus indolicus UPII9-5]